MARIIPASLPLRARGGRFWLIAMAALLGILTTTALGRWQLSRAAQKEAMQSAIESRRALPPLHNPALLAQRDALPDLLHRPVELRGRFVPEHTIFLDNRQMRGRPGFYVLTPMVLEHSNTAVLIQRGWVVRNFLDRAALPDIPTPTGLVQLVGRIAPVPAKLFEFEGEARGRIRQNLDLADYRDETRLDLPEWSVLQTAPEAVDGRAEDGAAIIGTRLVASAPQDGSQLLREWPRAGFGVETHYGYAFQWFGLSVLIACLYVWYQIVLPRRRAAAPAAR